MEAQEWCRKYQRSNNTKDLTQAWDLYYHVFRRISKQLPQVRKIRLLSSISYLHPWCIVWYRIIFFTFSNYISLYYIIYITSHIILWYDIFYCITLCCSILYYVILRCILVYYSILYYVILYYAILCYIILYCIIL